MRSVKMTELIRLSIGRTSAILFKPFNIKKWLLLLFIAVCAGALSFGSGNGGGGNKPAEQKKAVETSQSAAIQPAASASTPVAAPYTLPAVVITVIAVVAFLLILFTVLMAWVGARFKFVWFNAVVANDASIVEPFHRHRLQANSFFRASLVIGAVFLTAILVSTGWGIFNAAKAGAFSKAFGWSLPVALNLFAGPLISLLFIILIAVILSVAIDNFVVMVMAVDKIKFMKALGMIMSIYRSNLGDIILFHIVLLGLLIGSAIIGWIAAFVVLILGLILAGIVGLIGYVLFMLVMKLQLAFIIYCIVLGIPALIIMALALFCVQLPFSVFFRSFSIEYMCSLGCGYTYERLAEYAKERSTCRSKAAIAIPVVLLSTLVIVGIIGLLAAIAIPNFIRARDAALQKKAAAESTAVNPTAVNTP